METHLLEFRVLSFLRSRDAYLKYAPSIKEKLFESKESKYIYKLIVYYHTQTKSKKLVPLSSLFALVNSRIKENEAEKYKVIIRKIKKFPLTDESIADEIVKNFVQRQLMKMVIMDLANGLNKEDKLDILKVKERLDEAIQIEHVNLGDMDNAYNYFSNPRQRLEEDRNRPRVATGLHESLDISFRGGLAAGEIGVVVAPTSVGKTIVMLNVAYNALLQSKKVGYITLELSGTGIAGRFDQIVTGKSISQIEKDPLLVHEAIKRLTKKGGGFFIKDCVSNRLSDRELKVYLERLRKDFEFDMIIVDQMDLMYSPKEYKERRHELSNILISLRRMGATFEVPIWTASQANRAAGAAGSTSLWDIAEDIGKANWADVILTLSQSPEDKEEGKIYLDTAKNRLGPGNPKLILDVNYDNLRIRGITHDEVDTLPQKEKNVRNRHRN